MVIGIANFLLESRVIVQNVMDLDIIEKIIKIFFDMREDSLMQWIEDNKLKDKVNHVADKYEDDVLTKLNDATNILETCGRRNLCYL